MLSISLVLVFYSEVIFGHDGLESVTGLGDVFTGTLFTVDHADDLFNRGSRVGDDLSGFEDLPARRGDILDKQNDVASLQDALDPNYQCRGLFIVSNDEPVFTGASWD